MIRKANCRCGDCYVEVEGDPDINLVCHCSKCRQRTGSAFGWQVYFQNDRFLTQVGEFTKYDSVGDSGAVTWWFCGRCASTLFWKVEGILPGYTGVAAGCFNDEPMGPPASLSPTDGHPCGWLSELSTLPPLSIP
ncbi:MAG: aldehyde-activating protein [Gammaproteobacteria bacterium]|nr:MAG: aldehyde-activating protein [Gammaproteobacteria bacterium]